MKIEKVFNERKLFDSLGKGNMILNEQILNIGLSEKRRFYVIFGSYHLSQSKDCDTYAGEIYRWEKEEENED